jgi:hypothetical protein
MASITLTKRVDASVDVTFAAFTDLDRAAANVSEIIALKQFCKGPMQVGTRWRETRMVGRREATEELEVSAYHLNDFYTVVSDSCGSVISSTFRFVPSGATTDVVLELDVRPTRLVSKLLSPPDRIMISAMSLCMQQDLDDLARVAEGQAEAAGA